MSDMYLKISNFANSAINKAVRITPSMTISNAKVIDSINWIGRHISTPHNRLILGVSALMSQPFIDLNNKRVDEETRKTSAARTTAKIIAGTTSGFFVRYFCIKAIDAFTKIPKEGLKHWETLLSPDMVETGLTTLTTYKQGIGSILALGVMFFTNFAIDAPLTKYLTNKFIDKIHTHDSKKTANNKGFDRRIA